MCHRRKIKQHDEYGDGDIPEVDQTPYKDIEPLPESSRERHNGPGGD